MTMRLRLLIAVIAILVIIALPGAAAAQPGDLSKAHWDRMTTAQRDALVAKLTMQMEADVKAGRATVRVAEGKLVSMAAAAVEVWGGCRVEWITTPGTGDHVRAVAWTNSDRIVDRIETRAILFEDGVVRKAAFTSLPNDDHAGATTAYFFTAWWDTSEWRVRSEHTVIENGVFVWNKVKCTAAKTL
jgi:hypothetical protein